MLFYAKQTLGRQVAALLILLGAAALLYGLLATPLNLVWSWQAMGLGLAGWMAVGLADGVVLLLHMLLLIVWTAPEGAWFWRESGSDCSTRIPAACLSQ